MLAFLFRYKRRFNRELFTLLALMLLGCTLQSQYLPEVGSYWYYSGYYLSNSGPFPKYHVEVIKDSTINDLSFKVLAFISNGLVTGDQRLFVTESNGKISFLENDSLYTIIDFEAEVGDTLSISTPANWEVPLTCCGFAESSNYNNSCVITSKELIEENGQVLVSMEVDFIELGWGFKFSEKLSLPEFLPGETCCAGGFFGKRLCYKDLNGTFGANPYWTDHCDFPLSNDVIGEQIELNIFPNPASSYVQIYSHWSFETIRLTALDGSTWQDLPFQNSTKLDLTNLRTGLYILELTDENGNRIREKIVKH